MQTGSTQFTKIYRFGGLVDYTGPAWVDGSKQSPEYVLNARNTDAFFDVLSGNTVNRILDTLNTATYAMLGALGMGVHAGSVATNNSDLNQNVEIHADFPNVTERSEIEAAFDDLINRATQYANRR